MVKTRSAYKTTGEQLQTWTEPGRRPRQSRAAQGNNNEAADPGKPKPSKKAPKSKKSNSKAAGRKKAGTRGKDKKKVTKRISVQQGEDKEDAIIVEAAPSEQQGPDHPTVQNETTPAEASGAAAAPSLRPQPTTLSSPPFAPGLEEEIEATLADSDGERIADREPRPGGGYTGDGNTARDRKFKAQERRDTLKLIKANKGTDTERPYSHLSDHDLLKWHNVAEEYGPGAEDDEKLLRKERYHRHKEYVENGGSPPEVLSPYSEGYEITPADQSSRLGQQRSLRPLRKAAQEVAKEQAKVERAWKRSVGSQQMQSPPKSTTTYISSSRSVSPKTATRGKPKLSFLQVLVCVTIIGGMSISL